VQSALAEAAVQKDSKEMARPGLDQAAAFPFVTVGIIFLNILTFFTLPILFGTQYANHIERFGANWGPLTLSGQWWRLVTSAFIHIALFHLGRV
jgi:rhomboid protease GluP